MERGYKICRGIYYLSLAVVIFGALLGVAVVFITGEEAGAATVFWSVTGGMFLMGASLLVEFAIYVKDK